jgi:hypothetical protein
MKNSKYYVIAALFFLTLTLLFYSGRNSTESAGSGQAASSQSESESEQRPTDSSMSVKSVSPNNQIKKKKNMITTEEVTAFKKSLPDKQVVREEVEKDPHRTPESLHNFAQTSGPLIEKALKNKVSANELLNTLQDCALDESVAEAARALCVSNMEKIAKAHPEHKGKVQDLRKNLSPDVNRLLRRKAMLKN